MVDTGGRTGARYVIIYAHKLSIEIVVVVVFVEKHFVLCGDMYDTSEAQPKYGSHMGRGQIPNRASVSVRTR